MRVGATEWFPVLQLPRQAEQNAAAGGQVQSQARVPGGSGPGSGGRMELLHGAGAGESGGGGFVVVQVDDEHVGRTAGRLAEVADQEFLGGRVWDEAAAGGQRLAALGHLAAVIGAERGQGLEFGGDGQEVALAPSGGAVSVVHLPGRQAPNRLQSVHKLLG